MTALSQPWIIRILFPQSLPMDEYIDIVTIDHDALDRKRQLDRRKRFEITVDVALEAINLIRRDHQLRHPGCVFLFVVLTQ